MYVVAVLCVPRSPPTVDLQVVQEELVAHNAEMDLFSAYPELESPNRDFGKTRGSAIGLDKNSRAQPGSVASAIQSSQARSGDVFFRETNGRVQQQRRRLSTTTSQQAAATYYVEVVSISIVRARVCMCAWCVSCRMEVRCCCIRQTVSVRGSLSSVVCALGLCGEIDHFIHSSCRPT